MQLPWDTLLTIRRSGNPEITLYGIISAVDGKGRVLLQRGDQGHRLWTRSCLKPFQLLNHLHILQENYPDLKSYHYAMMMSSHSSEPIHQAALDEIMTVGGVDESVLQNTPQYPISAKHRINFKEQGLPPTARWADCSAKHLGFVMALKSQGKDFSNYLDKDSEHFCRMKKLLAFLCGREANSIAETTDGCRLPNYSFSAKEIACLYRGLFADKNELNSESALEELKPILECHSKLADYMHRHPEFVGGSERFDTALMSGKEPLKIDNARLIAKEGADGLLALAIEPCKILPDGLGLLVKSATGNDPRYFEILVRSVLCELGLLGSEFVNPTKPSHVSYECHFKASILPQLSLS